MLDTRVLRLIAAITLAVVSAAACGKKSDSASDAEVPEVSAAGVPDVASGRSDDADLRELSRYQLTMANVRKWMAVEEKLAKLKEQHPELAAENDKDATGDVQSFDEYEAEMERAIDRVPAVGKALKDAGLSVREYILITLAVVQAWTAQMVVQQGANPDSVARQYGIHPANVRFVREHQAEFAKVAEYFK